MRGMSRCLSVALLVGATAFLSSGISQGKDKKEPAEKLPEPEKARFQSVDAVQLVGTFYPSTKKNPPTAIVLHNIGEDRKKKAWVTLAHELQRKGFAVLTFDFRGHGESTEIVDKNVFWNPQKNNQNYFKRGAVGKDTIEQQNFLSSYYPVLCNDIAAARAFLERNKADSGEANTSNLIVIGAETSSTLGAIWINSEFSRYRFKALIEGGVPTTPETRSEGENSIVAAVWLGISPTLEKQPVNLANILNTSARIKGVAMSFWYGKEDATNLKYAQKLLDNSIFTYKKGGGGKKEKEDKYQYTTVVEVPSTKLTGSELLLKGKGVTASVGEYLESVIDARSNDRSDYRFSESVYKWKLSNGQFFPPGPPYYLNMKGDKNLMWSTYSFWR